MILFTKCVLLRILMIDCRVLFCNEYFRIFVFYLSVCLWNLPDQNIFKAHGLDCFTFEILWILLESKMQLCLQATERFFHLSKFVDLTLSHILFVELIKCSIRYSTITGFALFRLWLWWLRRIILEKNKSTRLPQA